MKKCKILSMPMLLFIAILVLSGCGDSKAVSTKSNTYGDISFDIQDNWDTKTSDDNYYYYIDDAMLMFQMRDVDIDTNLVYTAGEEIYNGFYEGLEDNADGFQLINKEMIYIQDIPTIQVDYYANINNEKYEESGVFFYLNGRSYSFTYGEKESISDISIFNKVIDSIKVNIEESETKLVESAPVSFFSYSGSGDDVVTGLNTNSISYLRFICNADGHKSVKGHHGNTYDLLVNTISKYSGNTLLYPNQEYTLEINSNGSWTVEAFTIGSTTTDSFSGSGDWVSPVFTASSDAYNIVADDGGGNFAVKGYYSNGSYDLLVNTVDPYNGKVMFKNKGEYSFFEITGERNWSIQP